MSAEAVRSTYANLRKNYPNAKVHASTFDDFYAANQPGVMDALPTVTQEIGDTWLYGDPSDPLKNVHFREMSRMRAACVGGGGCDATSATMKRFDRLLTKIGEHTWGEDTTWYLGDNTNWTNAQFQAALPHPNYQLTINSWREQRSYNDNARRVLATSSEGAQYTALAAKINGSLAKLAPLRPAAAALRAAGYAPLDATAAVGRTFSCAGVTVGFSGQGAVTTLTAPGGQEWASADSPLGLYTYQSLSADDFVAFDKDYGMGSCTPTSTDPGCHNFMKPNMVNAHPLHLEISPSLTTLWYKQEGADACSFAAQSAVGDAQPHAPRRGAFGGAECAADHATSTPCCGQRGDPVQPQYQCPAESPVCAGYAYDGHWGHCAAAPPPPPGPMPVHTAYGAPDEVWLTLELSATGAGRGFFGASFDVQWFNKTATRLAEASWVSFAPAVADAAMGWRISPYNGSEVDPADVVAHGATHLHAVGPDGWARYTGREGSLSVRPLDAPILSLGILSPFPTPGDNSSLPAAMKGGVHANVQNNIWNTNYVMWYPFEPEDAASRFRFELDFAPPRAPRGPSRTVHLGKAITHSPPRSRFVERHSAASNGSSIPAGGAVWPTAIYWVYVQIGSPPHDFPAAIDSGSGDLDVEGKGCDGCAAGAPNRPYDPDASHTSSPAFPRTFSNSYQTCDLTNPTAVCTISGSNYKDKVSLAGLGPVDVSFGSILEQTSNFDQFKHIDGVMGFTGGGRQDVFADLVAAGDCEKVWAICMHEGSVSNGTLTVGGVDPRLSDGEVAYVPDAGHGFHAVSVAAITLGSGAGGGGSVEGGAVTSLPVNKAAILDTGTNVLLLPPELLESLGDAMCADASLAHCAELWDNTCVILTDKQVDAFPPLALELDGGVSLKMTSHDYLLLGSPLATAAGQYCLGIRSGGHAGGSGFIIGDTTMRHFYLVFDLAQQRIGWGPVNKAACGSIGEGEPRSPRDRV